MKYYILSLLLPVLLFCGCTQYNGHIGTIFGSWSLQEIYEDGNPVDLYPYETVFSFQNEVVRVVGYDQDNNLDYVTRYGNFTETGKELTLKFQAQPTASGSYEFVTPDWLKLPLDGLPITFRIDTLKGDSMILTLAEGENQYTYRFKRTW